MSLNLNGGLVLDLTVRDRRVLAVELKSERPVGLTRSFAGLPVVAAVARLPLIYSICGTAQSVAGALAAAAPGDSQPVAASMPRVAALWAENTLERARGVLTGWGGFLDEPMDVDGLRAVTLACRAPELVRARAIRTVHDVIFGADGAACIKAPDDFAAWAHRGQTLAARTIAAVLEQNLAGFGASPVASLTAADDAGVADALAADVAEDFVARPILDGGTRDSGALAQCADHPLIRDLRARHGNGLLTRLAARLVELAGRNEIPEMTGSTLGPGVGIAAVECARGRLYHRIEIRDGGVHRYQILAPTEWNFHPDGPLVQGLRGGLLPGGAAGRRTVALLVAALDPCVNCDIRIDDGAP